MGAFENKNRHLRVKAVVFDFDGTLAVLNIDFSLMRERVFGLIRGLGIRPETIQERYLLEITDEIYQALRSKDPSGAEKFYRESHTILHEVEMKAAEEGRLIPGTKAALKKLRTKGIKIGIITRNCEDAVRKVFPSINDFCDVFVSRDSVKKVKPHPDHLTYAMKRLKTSGEEAVMVGDHIIDVQAGRSVGMRTVGVLTGRTEMQDFEKAGADYILRDASEVCKLLED